MKAKTRRNLKARDYLVRSNLRPIFRFSDSMFIYTLTEWQRKVLKVDEKNPGVVIVISE